MLIKNQNKIIESLQLDLFFEEDIEKHLELHVGDIVDMKYNCNGLENAITGKIIEISSDKHRIVIDGSSIYSNKTAAIDFDLILDCEVKDTSASIIKNDVLVRIYNNHLEFFNGEEWIRLIEAKDTEIINKEDEDGN